MMKILRVAALLATATLSGCGGSHVFPPANYSCEDTPDRVVRLVFDQDGRVYPPAIPRNLPPPFNGWGGAYRLERAFENCGNCGKYAPVEQYEIAAGRVNDALRRSITKSAMILVHGFNNDYREAKEDFADLRCTIRRIEPEHDRTFIEVYWDGLGNRVSATYWSESVTYSNLAGHVGLREVVNRLDKGTEVRSITHSRGAAVILSMLANPAYDPRILEAVRTLKPATLDPDRVKGMKVAMFAPAVGAGHFVTAENVKWPDGRRPELRANTLPPGVHFYASLNTKDLALRKLFLDHYRFGSTSLGTDPDFVEEVREQFEADRGSRDTLQPVVFEPGGYHGIQDYLAQDSNARCLLWGIGVGAERPAGCQISR